jgi:hypothetical protein
MISHGLNKVDLWAAAVVAVTLGLFCALVWSLPPGSDVLWRLHIGELIFAGQVLYRDVVEVNPPLWFWGALPSVLIGKITGVSPYVVSVAIVVANALLAVWLLGRLLQTSPRGERLTAQTVFLGVILLVPIAEIGQREQAFLVACVLWSGIAHLRLMGQSAPLHLLLLATAFAAYGFALKHYFLLAPILVELCLMACLRRAWRPFRVETVALGLAALAYGLCVVLLAPDFLTSTLPLVALAYEGFSPLQQGSVFQRFPFMLASIGFLVFLIGFVWASGDRRGFSMCLVLCTVASVIAVLWQGKGWGYHFIAAIGLFVMALAQSTSAVFARKPLKWAIAFGLVAGTGLAGLVWAAPQRKTLRDGGQHPSATVVRALAAVPKGQSAQVLSVAPENSFLAPVRAGHRFSSRYFSMWMIASLLTPRPDKGEDAARQTMLVQVRRNFAYDLMCAAPDRLISNLTFLRIPERTFFDPAAFLSQDPAFALWLATNYTPVAGPDTLRQWQRATRGQPLFQPRNCDQ